MDFLSKLNAGDSNQRLASLREVLAKEKNSPEVLKQFANNHIHTNFSFSPYSPSAAVYFARNAGLQTAGIMDHDSIAGAREFIEAGKIAGIATTIGLECRVSVKGTELEGRLVNNPDQKSVAYMALHGVPHTQIDYLQSVFAPLRAKRNERNIKMTANINSIFARHGISIEFESDVLPISNYSSGGSVTERHLLFALAKKIFAVKGNATADFISREMGINLSPKLRERLEDTGSEYFLYDLLGVLKADLVKSIYVDADEECLHISQLSRLADEIGALFCYAYLGDVGESVTADKATQKFEDSYLDLLFDVLKEQGVDAVTYMPSRNTEQQLARVMRLCREYGFVEISGEDINSPRQGFICSQLELPQYRHLIDATWNLINREIEQTKMQGGAI